MYTHAEYAKRVKELKPVAEELMGKYPEEARRIVSEMSTEDAYIIGIWIGKWFEHIMSENGLVAAKPKVMVIDVAGKYQNN